MSTIRAVILIAALLVPVSGHAQVCLGFAPGAGPAFLGGFEGTDGHVGWGGDLTVPVADASVVLGYRNMEYGLDVARATVVRPLDRPGFPFCLTGGVERIARDRDPDTNRSGYTRWRVPLGIALAYRFESGGVHALTAFVNPAVVFAVHRTELDSGGELGPDPYIVPGGTAGLTFSVGPVLIRGAVRHALVPEREAAPQHFPYLTVSLGLGF